MDTLYKQLSKARKQLKMTQAELSAKTGIAQGDISKIEREQIDARLSTIMNIAAALEVDLMAVPRLHKNKVLNAMRDQGIEADDISLLERYGVPDDE